ncbi:ABC transporter ATP-binding protein [Tabrizicola sp.]|uniref:ABC transporter ATP-binding protein n=1 Tax=Tabrizicola sp. TaxID=2005166 RepID=UPI00261917BD|nr:ABC transporter ATP-binding protein [Tabrizicola sp.]MDM7933644.1 ABC transporter ATP-binding protein [Tabrizicola sp.]
MLEVRNMDVGYYKDLNILQNVSIDVPPGKIVTILGANGVGKSTSLKAIYGFLRPNAGHIRLDGVDIVNTPTHERILKGLAYIPQHPGVFHDMSVEDNLLMGAWTFRKDKARIAAKIEANYTRFPILRDKRRQPAGELSGGQQRMVEIGRTLMGEPKVLLVDEPTAGLSKILAEEVYQMLRDLRDKENLGILLVDQEIRHALRIADYVYVLELGRNKFEGPPSDFDNLEKAFWVG